MGARMKNCHPSWFHGRSNHGLLVLALIRADSTAFLEQRGLLKWARHSSTSSYPSWFHGLLETTRINKLVVVVVSGVGEAHAHTSYPLSYINEDTNSNMAKFHNGRGVRMRFPHPTNHHHYQFINPRCFQKAMESARIRDRTVLTLLIRVVLRRP
jgi:hypothetical protein